MCKTLYALFLKYKRHISLTLIQCKCPKNMKEGTYMSELNYIIEMLELKDNNIKFYENCYHKEKIKLHS